MNNQRLIDGDLLKSVINTRLSKVPGYQGEATDLKVPYHKGKAISYENVLHDIDAMPVAPSNQGEATRLRDALIQAESFISRIMAFHGQGLSVYNWHQNGDGEPWDNFFDENMVGDELEIIRDALDKTKTPATGTEE